MRELDYESSNNENDKNIRIESDNIRNLLEEYENRCKNKKDELRLQENMLIKLEFNGKKSNEQMNRGDRKIENQDNIFKSNYHDKQTRSTNPNSNEFNNFERIKTRNTNYSKNDKILEITDYKDSGKSDKLPTKESKNRHQQCNLFD